MIQKDNASLLSQSLTLEGEIIWATIQARILNTLKDSMFGMTKEEVLAAFVDGRKKSLFSPAAIEAVLLQLAYEGQVEQSFKRFSLPRRRL